MAASEPIVRTVLSEIRPDRLGIIYGHEHLLGRPGDARSDAR